MFGFKKYRKKQKIVKMKHTFSRKNTFMIDLFLTYITIRQEYKCLLPI